MAKNFSVTELRDELAQNEKRANDIWASIKAENRMANAEENKALGEIQSEQYRLRNEIAKAELMEARSGHPYGKPAERFSLVRAIRAKMNGTSLNEADASYVSKAAEEHRAAGIVADESSIVLPVYEQRAAYSAAQEATTGVVIDEVQQEMLLPLEANLVLAKAGARMMYGLKGNIYWPSHNAVSVNWEGENDDAKDGSGAFEKGTVFAPKRLTCYVDISRQLLVQENRSVETMIRQLAASAMAQKIEQTAFANASHKENVPDGIFLGAESTVSGNMDWANIVKMEENVDLGNALMGNLAYIMHPSLVAKAKTEVKDTSGAGGFIFDGNGDGIINGYKALRTNNLPKALGGGDEYGIVFGNWSDYFVGQWGSMELIVDPYTQGTKGIVRLIFTGYFNMGAIRPESFAVGSLK